MWRRRRKRLRTAEKKMVEEGVKGSRQRKKKCKD